MFFNNYKNLKNKEIYLLTFLFLFSFIIRIPSIFIYGDTSLENEWRLLVSYLTDHGKLYSILPSLLSSGDFFAPNVFMPPLYAYYLYLFKISLGLTLPPLINGD